MSWEGGSLCRIVKLPASSKAWQGPLLERGVAPARDGTVLTRLFRHVDVVLCSVSLDGDDFVALDDRRLEEE